MHNTKMISREIVADLHNHSTASDGEYTPSELVLQASEIGLKAIALTDHDTISGLDEAVTAGHECGMKVIPGVEVSIRFKRPFFVGTLHLIIYFSETLLMDTGFRDDLNNIAGKGRGEALIRERVEAVNNEFGPDGRDPLLKKHLTIDEITSQSNNITRRHFYIALTKNHDISDPHLIDRLIGNTSPAYIPSGLEMSLLKPFLDKYPVVKVLAHPAAGSFPGESHYKEVHPPVEVVEQLLPELLDPDIIGIDGLEVYYPAHTKELEEHIIDLAGQHDLLITGGSDCHDREQRPLGIKGVDQDELDRLLDKIEGNI